MILFCSLCKHEETTFPHAFVFFFYFIRVILSKKCHKWGVGKKDIKGRMVIQGGRGFFCRMGGSNLVQTKFCTKKNSFPDGSFIHHRISFSLNTQRLVSFFVIFENFYMSLFGCFQFQAPTCFLKEIPLRYGSGQ